MAIFLIGTFGTDLILSWPFHHASLLFDIGSVLCGLGLCYLSWHSLRDFH